METTYDSLVLGFSVAFSPGVLAYAFLGCLVGLHQRFGRSEPPRFLVAASADKRQRLLAPLQLHRVLKLLDEAPQGAATWVALGAAEVTPRAGDSPERGRHLLECHRRLAELGSENEAVFGPLIEQLTRELEERAMPQVKQARTAAPRQSAHASW